MKNEQIIDRLKLFKLKLEQYRFCTFLSQKHYDGLIEELDDLFPKEELYAK